MDKIATKKELKEKLREMIRKTLRIHKAIQLRALTVIVTEACEHTGMPVEKKDIHQAIVHVIQTDNVCISTNCTERIDLA